MITLIATSTLEVLLGSTPTDPVQVSGSFIDALIAASNPATFVPTPFAVDASASGATEVIGSPAADTRRQLKELTIFNPAGNAAVVVSVQVNNGSVFIKRRDAIQPGESVQYNSGAGWQLGNMRGEQGETGATGPAGGFDLLELPFAWGDATPSPIGTALAGKRILAIMLQIETAFDGASPALTIGDAGDTDRLMLASENDPTSVGQYETHPVHAYGSDTVLNLYITPGAGASAGAGFAVIMFES